MPGSVGEVLHRGVPDAGKPAHRGLYLPGFHALTVDFDHPVLAVDVDQVSIRQQSAQVAGMNQRVKAIDVPEGIGRERMGGLLGQVQIAVSSMSGQADFTFIASFPGIVQQVELQVVNGLSNRGIVISPVHHKASRQAGCFRHAIGVHQRKAFRGNLGHSFARGYDKPQTASLLSEIPKHLGRDEEHRNVICVDKIRQAKRIASQTLRHNDGGKAGKEAAKYIDQMRDEIKRAVDPVDILGRHQRNAPILFHHASNALVVMQDALGKSRGTRSVENQRQVLRRSPYRHGNGFVLQRRSNVRIVNGQLCPAIRMDIGDTLGRIAVGQRHIHASVHQHAEDRRNVAHTSGGRDDDDVTLHNAIRPQLRGDPTSLDIQLPIGQCGPRHRVCHGSFIFEHDHTCFKH